MAAPSKKIVIGIAALAVIIAIFVFVPVGELLERFVAWVELYPVAGPLAFMAVYVLACVLLLPGSILTLGAGAAFGVVKGTILVSVASVAGATVAFILGRTLARDWVAKKVEGFPKFKAVDQAIGGDSFKMIFLIRLSPAFPFNLLNYMMGLTKADLKGYVLGSWLGMLPGTVMYVYLGSVLGDVAAAGERERSPAEWALLIVGLLATVAVTVLITRKAKAQLAASGLQNDA